MTGGALGIGQATAFRLAEAGASVMITDISLEAANQTVEQIKASGGKAQAIRADAGSVADANNVVQLTVESFGSLDILVNNAGLYPLSPILEVSERMWNRTHDVNLKGLFFYCQAAARQMIKGGRGGKIINIASIDALHPNAHVAHYCASKGGVVMLTKALALELAPYGILVNDIAPGSIVTPGRNQAIRAMLSGGEGTIKEVDKRFISRVPLRRIGEPDDIAKVVLFLASAAADYMTGSLVLVDGGYLLS